MLDYRLLELIFADLFTEHFKSKTKLDGGVIQVFFDNSLIKLGKLGFYAYFEDGKNTWASAVDYPAKEFFDEIGVENIVKVGENMAENIHRILTAKFRDMTYVYNTKL